MRKADTEVQIYRLLLRRGPFPGNSRISCKSLNMATSRSHGDQEIGQVEENPCSSDLGPGEVYTDTFLLTGVSLGAWG